MILVSKLQMAAMRRDNIAKEERRDFYLYIDEFQNYVTDSIESILSEARKYNAADYGGNMQYFCYVDVKITIKKIATGQSIYENQMSEKGGHSLGYDNAARVAYQELSPKISDIIKQQIQQ